MPNNTFSSLSSLTQLSLYGNSLQSPIPSELWDLEHLQYLSLSSNLFEEEISPEKLRKLGKMQRLDLSQNRFFGSVPQEITMLQDLRYLFLSSNNLSGKKKTLNPNSQITYFLAKSNPNYADVLLSVVMAFFPANSNRKLSLFFCQDPDSKFMIL